MDNASALIPRRTTAIVALLWLTARSAADAIQPHSSDWATQVRNKWSRIVYESLLTSLPRLGFLFRLEQPQYRFADPNHRSVCVTLLRFVHHLRLFSIAQCETLNIHWNRAAGTG